MSDDANEVRILRQEVETLRSIVERLLAAVETLTHSREEAEVPYEPRIVGGPEVR